MKTVLIQPSVTLKPEDVSSFGIFPPLGLAYLAGVLVKEECDVEILDMLAEGVNSNEPSDNGKVRIGLSFGMLESILIKKKPGIVGISNNITSFSQDAVDICQVIRKILPETLIVMGGAHASIEAKSLLATGFIDTIVIGEGEYIFCNLVKAFQKRDFDRARTIHGTVWNVNNQVIDNGSVPPISDIDKIPFPAYHLLNMDKYIWQNRANFEFVMRRPVGHVITSRGCVYNCLFCSTTKHFKKFRERNPRNVIDEMKLLIGNYGIKEFHFHDDCFLGNKERIIDFCNLIIKERLNIKWQVSQGINSNNIDDFSLALMHQSGMYRMGLPIESGCLKILKFIRKPIRLDYAKKMIERCNYLGIYCFGCFMIGFPEETEEELTETIDFIMDSGLDYVKISITQPLAGSDLYKVYQDLHLISESSRQGSTYINTEYDTKYFKAKELNQIRMEIFKKFARKRIMNILTWRGLKRFIFPKIKSYEDLLYFVKVSFLSLRGF